MSTQNDQFVKYAAHGGTIYEARRQESDGRWTVFRVGISESGRGEIKTFTTDLLHTGADESTEEEWMDAYFEVMHSAMEGEFIDDQP